MWSASQHTFARRAIVDSARCAQFYSKTNRFATQVAVEEKCPFTATASVPIQKEKRIADDDFENAKPFDQIPGPRGLPFFGIAHKFMPGGVYAGKSLYELHLAVRREYGDLVHFPGTMGKPPMVFSYSGDDIAKMFRTEGQWPYRMSLEVFDHFRKKVRPDIFRGYAGLVSDQGQQWYETRSKVNPVMLQPKTVKKYIDPVAEIVDEFIDRIRAIRDPNDEMPGDFTNEMNKWALESIATIGLDQRLGLLGEIPKDSDAQKLIENVHIFFELSFDLEVMPSIWKYYKTPAFKKMMNVMNILTDITAKMVDNAIVRLESKVATTTEDEMSVLEKLLKIDRHIAILMVLDMLIAGVDTTSMSTINVMYMLAKNPDKQAKLREEVLEKLPNKNSSLDAKAMANMPYLRACIKEAARMYPVTLGTVRRLTQDLVLSGYRVPKGMDVISSNMVLSHDEQYFKKADQFLPERFLKEGGDPELKAKHPFAFLPFGFGARMCVGRRFAELEMEVFISKVVRNFEIGWHYPDIKFVSTLINSPSGELKFQFKEVDV